MAAGLDLAAGAVAALAATLSSAERRRAERRALGDDRRRAIAARGVLRDILGRATDRDPAALDLRVTAAGRPHLADDAVSFSIAHCGDRALIALATDRPVGVDLERHRPVAGLPAAAARVVEPHAAAAIAALPERLREEAFLRWWTRAEAYGKARGLGLPAAIHLTLAPSATAPAAVRAVDGRDPGGLWGVLDLATPAGWSAAVAAAGTDWRVRTADAAVAPGEHAAERAPATEASGAARRIRLRPRVA